MEENQKSSSLVDFNAAVNEDSERLQGARTLGLGIF